jgi:hypothetical protein
MRGAIAAAPVEADMRAWKKGAGFAKGPRARWESGTSGANYRRRPNPPRKPPKTSDRTNNTSATKKTILAMPTAVPAIPPKPRSPAISAMTRRVITRFNIASLRAKTLHEGEVPRREIVPVANSNRMSFRDAFPRGPSRNPVSPLLEALSSKRQAPFPLPAVGMLRRFNHAA